MAPQHLEHYGSSGPLPRASQSIKASDSEVTNGSIGRFDAWNVFVCIFEDFKQIVLTQIMCHVLNMSL